MNRFKQNISIYIYYRLTFKSQTRIRLQPRLQQLYRTKYYYNYNMVQHPTLCIINPAVVCNWTRIKNGITPVTAVHQFRMQIVRCNINKISFCVNSYDDEIHLDNCVINLKSQWEVVLWVVLHGILINSYRLSTFLDNAMCGYYFSESIIL